MANPLDRTNAAQVVTLIEFEWGKSPVFARYARFTSEVSANGNTFLPEPKIEVDYGQQHFGTKDEPVELVVPSTLYPINRMIGARFWPTVCRIWECSAADVVGTLRPTWLGRIRLTTLNPSGRAGLTRVRVAGIKGELEARVGLPVLSFCPWTLGGLGCEKNLADFRERLTVSAISGRTVTLTPAPTRDPDQFVGGTLVYNGLELMVVANAGSAPGGWKFDLAAPPPPEFLNQLATLTTGCDGSIYTCRTLYDRESRFAGAGVAMPITNPQFESGT